MKLLGIESIQKCSKELTNVGDNVYGQMSNVERIRTHSKTGLKALEHTKTILTGESVGDNVGESVYIQEK